jgi:hypothetical protein
VGLIRSGCGPFSGQKSEQGGLGSIEAENFRRTAMDVALGIHVKMMGQLIETEGSMIECGLFQVAFAEAGTAGVGESLAQYLEKGTACKFSAVHSVLMERERVFHSCVRENGDLMSSQGYQEVGTGITD